MKKLRPKFFRYHLKKLKLNLLYKTKKLDFLGYYPATALGIEQSGATGYEPCYNINGYIKKCKPKIGDTFLDIGSGKGCALYYAKKFKFSRVDGVELSQDLYNTSAKNVEIIGDSRLHVFNEDATTFNGYDNYNLFFLYNPCFAFAMEKIVKKIKESYNKNNRKIMVIYVTAKQKQLFLDAGFKVVYSKKNDCIMELN